jgi:hypothetical protein
VPIVLTGTPDEPSAVTVSTVTVSGERPGVTSLALDPVSISDEGGDRYALAASTDATVRVATGSVPDVTGDGEPATDPDGDGVSEDVNGDGAVTPGDATVLFDEAFEG